MSALGQGMAGLALILSFGLLCVRRTGLALCLFAAQGLAVAIAVAALHDLPAAALDAAVALTIPWLLHSRIPMSPAAGWAWPMPSTLAAASVLSLLAAAAGQLALPLAILLLGLLLLVSRRSSVLHVLGICSLQQAALLATVSSLGTSPMLPFAVAIPVLPALALAGLLLQTEGVQPT